jgi:TonB-dependent starch-binding outer membrane protein SusC
MKLKKLLFLPVFALCSILAQAQIKGTVTSKEDGLPLPGASVIVSGTNQGTTTDFDGKYALNGVSKDATLLFSYIGYKTIKIPINGQNTINVQLENDMAQLNEVVLTGYSKERKVDVTGAISIVDIGAIQGQSRSSGNAMQALQGRVPGLFVEKTGDPTGAASNILIRGITTLGDNSPLYVIDGVPTKRSEVFASLNPESIESIQVLKDASAASLYGSRAGNGVIVVSTKSGGKKELVTVSFNSNLSVQSEKKQRYKMMNSLQRGQVLYQASINDGVDPNSGYGSIYNFDWNGNFQNPVLNSITPNQFVGGDTNVPVGDTDWQDEMYDKGFVYNNEVTIAANSEKSSLMMNFGYLKNTGMLKYTNYDRYSAKINGSTKLFNDKVRVGVNTQFFTSNENLVSPDVGSAPTTGLAITLAPTIPVYDSNGEFAGPIGAGYSDRNNPLLMQYLNRWDNANKNSLFGNVFAEIDLLKGLKFRTNAGLDFSDFKRKDIERKVNNGFIVRGNNRLIIDTNKFSSLVFSNTLNYDLEVGKNNKFSALLGYEYIRNDFDTFVAQADDFPFETEEFFVLNAATGARSSRGTSTANTTVSQFGKINYAYSDRYLASFTLRRDGSSRFGENTRFGIFPSTTVGWRISNEEFFKKNDIVTNLKLRAGYGIVGNQEIGDGARFGLFETRYGPNQNLYSPDFFNIYYNVGTAYDINGNNTGTLPSGFVRIQSENKDLSWEETAEYNYGVDFSLFNNNITGSFDYYTRETKDILRAPRTIATQGEGANTVLNIANTQGQGWELALAYDKTFDNGLTFGISTNVSHFTDKITKLNKGGETDFGGTVDNSIIGRSLFSIFGYRTDGLFQSQEDVNNSPTQSLARPGSIKYVDINGDGVINVDDRDWLGTTLPKFEYGVTINLAYKNFDLSLFGSGVASRIGQDPYVFYNNFASGRENGGVGLLNAWTPENTNTDVPSATLAFNDTRTSDYTFRKNSYFKLRNLQVGYSLPKDVISKIGGMTSARFYLQGENLLWITHKDYIGPDPERTDVNRIPVPTVLSLGFNLNF